MRKISTLYLSLAVLFFVSSMLKAEDLTTTLNKLASSAGKSYLGPASSGYGSNLNTSWFSGVPEAKIMGLDIEVGLVGMGAILSDENKVFSTSGQYSFTRDQASEMTSAIGNSSARNEIMNRLQTEEFTVGFSGPTILGKKYDDKALDQEGRRILIDFAGKEFQTSYGTYTVNAQRIPLPVGGLLDGKNILPFAAPQISIGTIYGTRATFRFLPNIELNSDLGTFKYFGFGIMHNPGVWMPQPLPVNIAVGFFTQKLKVGDILESKATQYGIFASRTFGPGLLSISPYAGFTFESSTLSVNYQYKPEITINGTSQTQTIKTSFDLDGENSSKLTLGVSFRMGFTKLNVDYNFAKYKTIGAGLSFVF